MWSMTGVKITILCTASALVMGACNFEAFGVVRIEELLRNPGKYAGKTVRVRGAVVNALQVPLVGTRFYVVKDDTGTITVVTDRMVATVGETITVEGNLDAAGVLGTTTVGLHIREKGRW